MHARSASPDLNDADVEAPCLHAEDLPVVSSVTATQVDQAESVAPTTSCDSSSNEVGRNHGVNSHGRLPWKRKADQVDNTR